MNGRQADEETPGSAPREGQEPALGYVSVRKRSASEKELREQTAAIQTACRERGLLLERVIVDAGQADATLSQRPGMRKALQRLASDKVSCLVVAGLGRLNCSPPDVGRLILWLRLQEAGLVAVDEEIDTRTQSGGVAADMLAALCAVGEQPAASAGSRPTTAQRLAGTRGAGPGRQ